MCGRFVSTAPPDQIAQYFAAEAPEAALEPSYNVAPTNDVYTVLSADGVRRVVPAHWGLVPFWAKDPKIGSKMINARAETLAEKNAYKSAFRKKRCIIPADGFYEWTKVPGQKKKQPWFLHRADGEPLAFAGLWSTWTPRDAEGEKLEGESLRSATIITCEANKTVEPIHDRMPVVLPPDAWDAWLDPDLDDTEALQKLLKPAPDELITMHKVSTEVNNVRNKGAELIERLPEDAAS